jgi:hypothetical protein
MSTESSNNLSREAPQWMRDMFEESKNMFEALLPDADIRVPHYFLDALRARAFFGQRAKCEIARSHISPNSPLKSGDIDLARSQGLLLQAAVGRHPGLVGFQKVRRL